MYAVEGVGNARFDSRDFGYHVTTWSFEMAFNDAKAFSVMANKGYGLSSAIVENPFPAILNLAAVCNSVYISYAKSLKSPGFDDDSSLLVKMSRKSAFDFLCEKIQDIPASAADRLSDAYEDYVIGYVSTQEKDFDQYHSSYDGSFRADPSFTALLFIKNIEVQYREFSAQDALEKYHFGFYLIDKNISDLYSVIKNELRISRV